MLPFLVSWRQIPITSTFWRQTTIKGSQILSQITSRRQMGTMEIYANNFAVIATNSFLSQLFIESYQGLATFSWISPTTAILATTLGFRLVTVPFFVQSEKMTSKKFLFANTIRRQNSEKIAKHYGVSAKIDEKTGQWTVDTADQVILRNVEELCKKEMDQFVMEHKLSSARILCLKMATFPIWIQVSMGLKSSIDANIGQQFPGFLWMDSLSATDPYMVFPLCFFFISFINIWAHKWMYIFPSGGNSHLFDATFLLITIFYVKMLMDMPAIQSLYWCTIILTNLVQTLIMRHPTIKKKLKIDRLPTDSNTPFRDIFRFRRQHLSYGIPDEKKLSS